MRILITGSRGLLGGTCLPLAEARHDCRGVDLPDLDVRDHGAVMRSISEFEPEAVLHFAAYTNVDGAETEQDKAMEINSAGAEWVARAAHEVGAVMVYVSTDYVFDGLRTEPYREDDPPRPVSHYGISKLEGERRVAEICAENYLIVRTSWLFGPGKGFVDWVSRRLDETTPIYLVADHKGSPTFAEDLARAILRLVEQGHRGVFHFVNKGETSWLGFGRKVAELTGRSDGKIEGISSAALGRLAKRPAYSVMAVDKYEGATGDCVSSWENALERYLARTGQPA